MDRALSKVILQFEPATERLSSVKIQRMALLSSSSLWRSQTRGRGGDLPVLLAVIALNLKEHKRGKATFAKRPQTEEGKFLAADLKKLGI